MKILNNLIEDLLSRSEVRIGEATFAIALKPNAIKISGTVPVTVVDTEKPGNAKVLAHLTVPLTAQVAINEVTFPVPTLK